MRDRGRKQKRGGENKKEIVGKRERKRAKERENHKRCGREREKKDQEDKRRKERRGKERQRKKGRQRQGEGERDKAGKRELKRQKKRLKIRRSMGDVPITLLLQMLRYRAKMPNGDPPLPKMYEHYGSAKKKTPLHPKKNRALICTVTPSINSLCKPKFSPN